MRRDITFLALGGGSLLLSFFAPAALPVNPAWLAILLCGAPIVREAAVGLFTRFDIKADVLVSLALLASVAIGEIFAPARSPSSCSLALCWRSGRWPRPGRASKSWSG